MAFPGIVQFETINVCNHHCPMCPSVYDPTPSQRMTDKLIDKIIQEIQNRKFHAVLPFWLGEPLLDGRIFNIITRLSTACDAKVILYSNAALLTQAKAQLLVNSGVTDVVFSIHGHYRDTYVHVHGADDRDIVYSNVEYFLSIVPPNISRAVNLNKSSAVSDKEAAEFRAYWTPKGAQVQITAMNNIGGQVVLPYERYSVVRPEPFCRRLLSSLIIKVDGTVCLCCNDFKPVFNLGNVNNQTIEEIWNGAARAKAVAEHQKNSICSKCNIW